MAIKHKCPSCKEKERTFILGAASRQTYVHCNTCGHDFIVDQRHLAWTDKEVKEVTHGN